MSGTLYIRRNGVNLEVSHNSSFAPIRTTTSITTNGEDEYSEINTTWNTTGNSTETIGAISNGFSIDIDSSVYHASAITHLRLRDSNDTTQDILLNTSGSTSATASSGLSHRFFILTDQDGSAPSTRIHFRVEINPVLYIRKNTSNTNNLEIADNSNYTNATVASSKSFNSPFSTYTDYNTTWNSSPAGVATDLVGYFSGFDIVIDSNVYDALAYVSLRIIDSADNTQTITLNTSGSTTATLNSNVSAPFFILSDNDLSPPATKIQFSISELCVAPFTKIPKIVEIKDVAVGDIIRTSRGDLPISHIMKTQTGVHKEYVKFEKGCLAPNLPSDDFYVTEPHPLSLGFYKNEVINNGKYDDKEDDYIMLQIAAGELVGTIPGITKVTRDFGHYYNLVFDEHASIDMEGLDVCSHHPRTGPFFLPRDKYIDNSKIDEKKIDKKITNPKFIRMCDLIIRYKPENVELKEFLAGCLTSDLNKKRQLVN